MKDFFAERVEDTLKKGKSCLMVQTGLEMT